MRYMLIVLLLVVSGCCKERPSECPELEQKEAPECPQTVAAAPAVAVAGLAESVVAEESAGDEDCPSTCTAEDLDKACGEEGEEAAVEAESTGVQSEEAAGEPVVETAESGKPTVAEAEAFMAALEEELLTLWIRMERTNWLKATHITHDTEVLAAEADAAVMEFIGRKAAETTRFDGLDLPPELGRKFRLLRTAMPLAAPQDSSKRNELTEIATFMDSTYGKGKYCSDRAGGTCFDLVEMYNIMAESSDYDELLDIWRGWRLISRPMRSKFQRYVELANEGAAELGFKDLGDLWKSGYDMPPADFQKETDRLWEQVKPLYQDLHCFVRGKLVEKYGADRVPAGGPIPAHLLGNMWAQEWNNIYPLLAPEKEASFSLDEVLKSKELDEVGMTKIAEAFFVSLGLDPLPESFWERSMFSKPRDREVVCHASAWDIDYVDDLRIKMCIRINAEDFTTIHHELGHNYYQRAYAGLPTLFRNSANDGFHEALGDVISLSVTPSYLVQAGLLAEEPPDSLNPLMKRALDKVAFLPFGLLVDRWRWDVFSGRITAGNYNEGWWELRQRYQGVAPPTARTEEDFDPGAKYHVPANVPYTRYFLATILQFQFHRELCKIAGHEGPLHKCSIYNNKEAGKRLNEMMKLGMGRPWPEALKALTGQTEMDATAMLDYFKPLHDWLKEQNQGRTCGW